MKFFHQLLLNYYSTIYQDCLDNGIKDKLKRKMAYHEMKIID